MQLDLTDDETAALTRLLANTHRHRSLSALASYPSAERHPRQDRAATGSRAVAAAEGVRATASNHNQKTPPRVKSDPGPPMTLGNAAAARFRLIAWCKACQHQVEPDDAEQSDATAPRCPFPNGGSGWSARNAVAARLTWW